MTQIKNFNFGNGVKATIFCKSRKTRNGFAHDCAIPALKVRATCYYFNRTWEFFDFESVIHEAFYKHLKAAFPGKANERVRDRAYPRLTQRLADWYCKGKFAYVREFEDEFKLSA